jgi:hypothetical protein
MYSLYSPVRSKSWTHSHLMSGLMKRFLENTIPGKATPVVVVMHSFGKNKSNSLNANAKISAKKAKLGSKSKKIGLNQPKTHLEEVQQPQKDTSERLFVKRKTIRVLLDTGLSGGLLFLEKVSNKYRPIVNRAVLESGALPTAPLRPKSWVTSSSPLWSTLPVKGCTCTRI